MAGVSLEVAEGELVSVIGPNGAGKTTLFNLVGGQDRPDGGSVLLGGRDATGAAPERMAELGLARTFQHGRVFPNLSVLDNVLIGAHTRMRAARRGGSAAETVRALLRPAAVRREEAMLRVEAEAVIAGFGDRLTPRLHDPAHTLSYANRRRVEIARALMLRPRLLLLDEPTAGMNQTETAEMLAVLRGLKAGGQTVLLIEHKLEIVFQLSDRVVAMDDGRAIAAGLPGVVRADPAVVEAYLGHGAVGVAAGVSGPDAHRGERLKRSPGCRSGHGLGDDLMFR